MLAPLLPPSVVVVELNGEAAPTALPEGAPTTERAVPQRVAEFASGRWCAEQALARLGVPFGPVAIGPGREPLWPSGVVGSITHSGTRRAAAVAHEADVAALGVDVEVDRELPPEVVDDVLTGGERARFADGAARLAAFSVKEAVFKAWFPRTGLWLDFRDVDLEPLAKSGIIGFRVRPTASAPRSAALDLGLLRCQAHVGAGYVAATAHLPGPRPPRGAR